MLSEVKPEDLIPLPPPYDKPEDLPGFKADHRQDQRAGGLQPGWRHRFRAAPPGEHRKRSRST